MTPATIALLLCLAPLAAPQDPTDPTVRRRDPSISPESVTLRMYDVRELLTAHPDEDDEAAPRAPRLGLRAADEPGTTIGGELAGDGLQADARALGEMISSFIHPPLGERHLAEVAKNGSVLVVRGTEEHHRWVQDFLSTQRRHLRTHVEIQHQFFFLDEDDLRALHLEPGSWLVRRKSASEEDARARLAHARLMRGEVGDSITAPSVMTLNRQRFTISVINQHSYVKYYKVHERVEPRNLRVVDPVIDVVSEGLVVDGRAALLGAESIGIHLQVTLSELERPMREEQTELGVIGIPVLKTTGLETQVALVPGDAFLYVGPRNAAGKCFAAIVRAQVVPLEPVGEGRSK